MAELMALSEKLSALGLPTLLLLVLIGGYKKWWVWGWQLVEAEARCAALSQAAMNREEEWKKLALSAAGIAETSVDIARRRG